MWSGQVVGYFIQDVQMVSFGLLQGLFYDFFGDVFDFDVYLQGGDVFSGIGYFEVYVVQVIFVIQDVGQDYEMVVFFDQVYGDIGYWGFYWYVGVYQCQ